MSSIILDVAGPSWSESLSSSAGEYTSSTSQSVHSTGFVMWGHPRYPTTYSIAACERILRISKRRNRDGSACSEAVPINFSVPNVAIYSREELIRESTVLSYSMTTALRSVKRKRVNTNSTCWFSFETTTSQWHKMTTFLCKVITR